MGAYGGTAEASKSYFSMPLCQTIVAGDINGDCIVDFTDIEILLQHWMENEKPVNLKVIDDIEFHVQTDKTFYNIGESVQMTFTVTNLTDEEVRIRFYQEPGFNLLVQKDGMSIYQVSLPENSITLNAGESQGISNNWDMKDDDGYPVGPGTYHVIGEMYENINRINFRQTQVRIPITIAAANGS